MKITDVQHYICPRTGQTLQPESSCNGADDEIVAGNLVSADGSECYEIRDGVPRFAPVDNYATSFGLQWNRYMKVQLDSCTGLTLSRDRFYNTSRWDPRELTGLKILEAGCGAGRFTEIALQTGAELFSFDYSNSVDAVQKQFDAHHQLHLAQADIFQLPYPENHFDRVFCYGVLQHTPDPRRALLSLVSRLKPGGFISFDVYLLEPYPTRWNAKYLWRPVTKRMKPDHLFKLVEWYIPRWLPVDTAVSRVRVLGRLITSVIPCWNYTDMLPLTHEQLVEWAMLDTFDALSPAYDRPATIEQVRRWCSEAGLIEIEVVKGGNGIIANARKPLS